MNSHRRSQLPVRRLLAHRQAAGGGHQTGDLPPFRHTKQAEIRVKAYLISLREADAL